MPRSSNFADDAVVVYSAPNDERRKTRQIVYRIPRDQHQRRIGNSSHEQEQEQEQRQPQSTSSNEDESLVTVEGTDGRTVVYKYKSGRNEQNTERASATPSRPDRNRHQYEWRRPVPQSRSAPTRAPERESRQTASEIPRRRRESRVSPPRVVRESRAASSSESEAASPPRKRETIAKSTETRKSSMKPRKVSEKRGSDTGTVRQSSNAAPPPPPPPMYYPPPGPPPSYPAQPMYAVPQGYPPQGMMAQPQESGARRFGKKLGNAAIFGVGFTAGADLLNGVLGL